MSKSKKTADTPQVVPPEAELPEVEIDETDAPTEAGKSEIESKIDEAKTAEEQKAKTVKKIVEKVKTLFAEHEMQADAERILCHHVAAPMFCRLLANRLRKVHDPTGGVGEVQAIAACVARSIRQVERIATEAEKMVTEKKIPLDN